MECNTAIEACVTSACVLGDEGCRCAGNCVKGDSSASKYPNKPGTFEKISVAEPEVASAVADTESLDVVELSVGEPVGEPVTSIR